MEILSLHSGIFLRSYLKDTEVRNLTIQFTEIDTNKPYETDFYLEHPPAYECTQFVARENSPLSLNFLTYCQPVGIGVIGQDVLASVGISRLESQVQGGFALL